MFRHYKKKKIKLANDLLSIYNNTNSKGIRLHTVAKEVCRLKDGTHNLYSTTTTTTEKKNVLIWNVYNLSELINIYILSRYSLIDNKVRHQDIYDWVIGAWCLYNFQKYYYLYINSHDMQ